MKIETVKTYFCEICLGGDYSDALRICKEYCTQVGLCVTVTKTEFVYKHGAECGVLVRLVQYPRFLKEESEISQLALNLAKELIYGLFRQSALFVLPEKTVWLTLDDYKGKE